MFSAAGVHAFHLEALVSQPQAFGVNTVLNCQRAEFVNARRKLRTSRGSRT
jgi:hypothetical protein